MFTVLIQHDGGLSEIREANSVDFRTEGHSVMIYHPMAGADGLWEFTDGKVFVMNASGKTVATYNLGAFKPGK